MPPFRVRALGEVAIRCADLVSMWAFYRDVIGLSVLREPGAEAIGFFRIAPGHAGHTTVLALFGAEAAPETGARSSLHHLALSVDVGEQPAIMDWLTAQGVPFTVQVFGWIGWRGIFVHDPEGNTVEFVAADPAFRDPPAS